MLRLVQVKNDTNLDTISDRDVVTLQLFDESTLEICRNLQLDCVDLATQIDFNDGDFYDGIHTTPSGSRKIAVIVHEALKDKLKPKAGKAAQR